MNKKIKIYIHIGFPKTASTLIQKHYFPKLHNVNYLSKENDFNLNKLFKIMFFYPIDKFNLEKKKIESIVSKIKFHKHKSNIISDESFTDLSTSDEKNPLNLIKKFKNCFPKNKYSLFFLVVTRNQADLILSHYAYCYKNFLLRNFRWNSFNKFVLSINQIQYKNYFTIYNFNLWKNLFIKEKVNFKFFIYETLNKNPNYFFRQISKYINTNYVKIGKIRINTSKKNSNKDIFIRKNFSLTSIFNNMSDICISPIFFAKKKIKTFFKNIFIYFLSKNLLASYNSETKLLIKNFYLKDNLLFINSEKDFKNYLKFYKFF